MVKFFSNIKSRPIWQKLLFLIIIGISLLLIINLISSNKKSKVDNSFIIEDTKIRTQIEAKENENKKLREELDSIEESYKEKYNEVTESKIDKKHENEKNRISNIPIDSTVRNLSKWVSENNKNR